MRDGCVKQLIPTGNRCYDYQVRALLAGMEPERVCAAPKPEEAAALVDLDKVDKVYILHAVFTVGDARRAREELIRRINGKEVG